MDWLHNAAKTADLEKKRKERMFGATCKIIVLEIGPSQYYILFLLYIFTSEVTLSALNMIQISRRYQHTRDDTHFYYLFCRDECWKRLHQVILFKQRIIVSKSAMGFAV